jgi:predicted nucleic acid-binding protein
MESAILGVVLDSSVLIAGERRTLTAAQVIEDVVKKVGAVAIILSVLTVAEIGHGIYRANTPEIRRSGNAGVLSWMN